MPDIPVYKIDKDVPVPPSAGRFKVKELVPIDDLTAGDSIEFSIKLRANVATLASRLQREGKTFTIKKVSDTTARIWRIK